MEFNPSRKDEFERPKKGDSDRSRIHLAQSEIFVVENNWEEAWCTYEKLHKVTIEKGFLRHANPALGEWGFALLEQGHPKDQAKALALLQESRDKFRDMDADGFVELMEGKLAHIE